MIAWVLRRLRGEAGFTLVEMLTVMTIMSVVFAGITTAFVSASKAQNDQDRRFRAQLNTRLGLDKIRKDLHCASDVTPSDPTQYPRNSVTIKLPTGCGGDVSWCTVVVSGFTNRYALYRQSGASCGATGVKYADYLTTANVFPAFAHATGCGCLASLQLDFPVSLSGSTIGQYELTDTVFLRNSTRI